MTDETIITTILALLAGPAVALITQALKKWLKIEGGLKAKLLAGVLSIGAVAYVLVSMHTFTLLGFALYAAVVFGEATGLYHFRPKPITPTA